MLSLFDRGFSREAIKKIDENKVLFVVGPRKSGKTQLITELMEEENSFPNTNVKRFNCDNYNVRKVLDDATPREFQKQIDNYSIVIIEEAQNLGHLDALFKAIVDKKDEDTKNGENANQRIIITLSSLEQRKPRFLNRSKLTYEIFYLFPISAIEIAENDQTSITPLSFERIMRFGLYPEVWQSTEEQAREVLEEITSQYLFRDLLEMETIKKPALLREILRLLALNVGNEISISKLAKFTGLDDKTVERYINHLIEAFIIFRIRPLNRRGKNEVRVRDKYFFWDLGIRNCLIDNFGNMANRIDRDQLWLNLCIAERLKANILKDESYPGFFWRTHDKQGIDFVEQEDSWIVPYKLKWNEMQHIQKSDKEIKTPPEFRKLYGIEKQMCVSQDNFLDFLKQ